MLLTAASYRKNPVAYSRVSLAWIVAFGTIEAVKAVSDLFSPVTGKVVEVNGALDDDPMVVNREPYGDGWMIAVKPEGTGDLDSMMDQAAYRAGLKG